MIFWLSAALLVLVALAFVCVPLLRRPPASEATSQFEANLAIYRRRKQELADEAQREGDAANTSATEEEFTRQAAADLVPPQSTATMSEWRKQPLIAIVGALLVVATAAGFYWRYGQYGAVNVSGTPDANAPRAAADHAKNLADIEGMVASLAAKLKENPQDVDKWILFARSNVVLGRFDEAVKAYEKAHALSPRDAALKADYADALAASLGRKLEGRPIELVREALQLDPKLKKALALAATHAMLARDLPAAVGYWERLKAELPADSDDANQLGALITELRAGRLPQMAAERVQPAPTQQAAAPAPQPPPKAVDAQAAAQSAVSGRVEINKELQAKVAASDTVFVLARAPAGPPVPYAVMRMPASELPKTFTLDDSMSMAPGMNLSSAKEVVVVARVSKSGNAKAAPGDLEGMSAPIKPGTKGITITIDRVVQ